MVVLKYSGLNANYSGTHSPTFRFQILTDFIAQTGYMLLRVSFAALTSTLRKKPVLDYWRFTNFPLCFKNPVGFFRFALHMIVLNLLHARFCRCFVITAATSNLAIRNFIPSANSTKKNISDRKALGIFCIIPRVCRRLV